jgi:valyl-tRNA synthetase
MKVYWAAAMDHGGTSTEFVVEKSLRDNGVDTSGWTRERWRSAIGGWVDRITPTIYEQLREFNLTIDLAEIRSMGDATRQGQFDGLIEQLNRAGLMYRAKAVVKWCPVRRTSVDKPDIVREHASLREYCVRYVPEGKGADPVDIWIDRPETLVNDAALVISSVHPLARSHGPRRAETPIGLCIPIWVDDEFFEDRETPLAARITPGHCARSFRWAAKNGFGLTRAYDEHNVMEAEAYRGMTRADAAEEVLSAVASAGRLVGQRERSVMQDFFRLSGGPVEDFLTEQCFLETKPLAERALELMRDRKVRVYPDVYHKTITGYLEQILAVKQSGANHDLLDDWCASHQTVWGTDLDVSGVPHRGNGDSRTATADGGGDCGGNGRQIANMRLSAALWAFCANRVYASSAAALRELSRNTILVAGLDNLFFWVVPTLMLSTVLEDGLPLRDVIIHPLIRDDQGRKMSKSLGNVVVPNEMLRTYGSDALRLALLWRLDLPKDQASIDEAAISEARKRLDGVAASVSSMKRRLRSAPAPATAPVTAAAEDVAQDVFAKIDAALGEYDFATAMRSVDDILTMLRDGGALEDEQEMRRRLGLLPILEPFAPELVRKAQAETASA